MPAAAAAAASSGSKKSVFQDLVVMTEPGDVEDEFRGSVSGRTPLNSTMTHLDANDLPEGADEPGPGHYWNPSSTSWSSFGPQKFSKCASAPEISFGVKKNKEGREIYEKVRITNGHHPSAGRTSPGPIYQHDSSLNRAGAKVGTGNRPDLAYSGGCDPYGSPGPCTYNVDKTLEHLADEDASHHRPHTSSEAERRHAKDPANNRMYNTFGNYRRFKADEIQKVGPDTYDRKDHALRLGTGKSFGCSGFHYDKVIRPGWEREGVCKTSKGVGPPMRESLTEPMPASPKATSLGRRAQSMGRAERFPADKQQAQIPGPGNYERNERGMANLGSSMSDTRSPSGCRFGRQPKKPRFRPHLALHCSNSCWGYF